MRHLADYISTSWHRDEFITQVLLQVKDGSVREDCGVKSNRFHSQPGAQFKEYVLLEENAKDRPEGRGILRQALREGERRVLHPYH